MYEARDRALRQALEDALPEHDMLIGQTMVRTLEAHGFTLVRTPAAALPAEPRPEPTGQAGPQWPWRVAAIALVILVVRHARRCPP